MLSLAYDMFFTRSFLEILIRHQDPCAELVYIEFTRAS